MSARPAFLEPLPLPRSRSPSPQTTLRIRVPALRTWKCGGCCSVYPEEAKECELCYESDCDSEEEEDNCWYCRICDDFCSHGRGICVRCDYNYGS